MNPDGLNNVSDFMTGCVFDQLLSEADRWELFSRSSSAAVTPDHELHIYTSTHCCEGHWQPSYQNEMLAF